MSLPVIMGDRPQEWVYRMSKGTGYCAECGAMVDGLSAYWCRRHARHLGSLNIPVTQEVLDRLRVF